jgi:PBP1b-binding outer membrane lipoprotein LpoB
LKGLETASAFTKLDANMRRDKRLASAALVALATVALSGCGADDSAPSATSSSPAVAHNDAAPDAAMAPAAAMLDASSTLAANPTAASDPITQNMQASLAADSQQVSPVMHYAPGDSASSN